MKLRLLLALALALGLVAAGWRSTHREAPAPRALVLHGNMDIRQVELAFNASGRIEQMLVQEGERVHKGQVLAKLDTERLAIALRQAQALAEAERQRLARLEAGSRPEEIRQAAAESEAARSAVREARQYHARQVELVAKHFISQQQADSAKNALDGAEQRLRAAEELQRLAVLGPRREDIAAAVASLAAQDAAVAGLAHDIAEGELRAPDEGVIESRVLEPGDMASPQRAVYTLALSAPRWARVYLPEAALGRVPPGAHASITTDSHPDAPHAGWVGYVAPVAEFTPKNIETTELRTSLVYQARVYACDRHEALRQGMPVTVTIAFDQPAAQPRPCAAGE